MPKSIGPKVWMPLSILFLTWGVYLNSLGNSFHFDDSHSIVENYHIRNLGNIPRFFVDPQTFSREPAMAMYRPLLLCSYAINYALGGYEPRGYRLVNLCLHGGVALMVYLLLFELGISRTLAWGAGMIFGVHPIHSQGVNYLSSRSEVMCVLGVLMAAQLMLVRQRGNGGTGLYGGALVAYGAALLSKAAGLVLLPLLMLLRTGRAPFKREWKEQLPFWILTLGYLGVIVGNGFLTGSLSQDVRPYEEQIFTQFKGLVYYAKLIFMPVRLSVEHGFSVSRSLLEGVVLGSVLLVGSLGYLAWRGVRSGSWGSLAVGWFLAGLGVTFLVPLNVLINEHRLYLPFVGLLVGVMGYCGRREIAPPLRLAGWGLLVVLAVLTWQRNRIWEDEFTLWQNAAIRAPGMFRAQSNLGLAQYEKGDLDGALESLQRALELDPHYSKTWNNLGLVYEDMGRYDQARAAYERAIELRPDLAKTFNNLGRLSLQLGRSDAAETYLRRALEIDPLAVEARVNLGLVHQRSGRLEAAEEEYAKALQLDPQYAEGYNNLGLLYQEAGRSVEALLSLEKAVQLRPDYEDARVNARVLQMRQEGRSRLEIYEQLVDDYPARADLWKVLGEELARQGEWQRAIKAFEGALQRNSRLRGVFVSLAGVYRSLGDLEGAIAVYERGLEVEGESLELYNNLASAYAASGRLQQAIDACERALEIDPKDPRAGANLEKLIRATRGQ